MFFFFFVFFFFFFFLLLFFFFFSLSFFFFFFSPFFFFFFLLFFFFFFSSLFFFFFFFSFFFFFFLPFFFFFFSPPPPPLPGFFFFFPGLFFFFLPTMVCSAVYVLDLKGKVIICRNYRGDIPISIADNFIECVVEEEECNIRPVFIKDGVTYVYLKTNNLYFLAVTQRNSNTAMILMFLQRLLETFRNYFQDVEEEVIRDNFVIVYELLDEMMDFGYPQTTDPRVLKDCITQQSNRFSFGEKKRQLPPPTGAVSWRQPGIRYSKNQVYLDVLEHVNLLVSSTGVVLSSEIAGQIMMKTELTGMPELKLGLNDRLVFQQAQGTPGMARPARTVDMEDVRFHQCVRLSRFDSSRTISFIPPDGEFELMSYRVSKASLKPLIWIENAVERHSHSRVEYFIKLTTHFKERSQANNVVVCIPVPRDVDSPVLQPSIGKCMYAPERDVILWRIKSLRGGKQYVLHAQLGLSSTSDDEHMNRSAPITVNFEIPYFTVSGIQVRYLKIVEKSNYQALPWVRYITKSGEYQIRQQADRE
eukprot:gnl/Trimastix_PCT/2493.p1 GENE.gnl/Trimastix_PCT/2493~~gnl/Trimastix_PCT/2493.p1  ORF type:complete len:551 (+),score=265.77 gnl/Trimastix_PCT/2493:62-1654(+)